MNERATLLTNLINDAALRTSYLRAKLDILIPAQIRALRKQQELTQTDLATAAEMKQSRISGMERPGATNFNLETLVRVAAALRVGLRVEFVPFSKVLEWENAFSQDNFFVPMIEQDQQFLYQPQTVSTVSAVSYQDQPTKSYSTSASVIGSGYNGDVATAQNLPGPVSFLVESNDALWVSAGVAAANKQNAFGTSFENDEAAEYVPALVA